MENSIEEDIERLKLCSTNQCNICGRYEKEECMLERNRCEQHILSNYKRVLKENEEWDRKFCNLQNLYFKLQDEFEAKRREYQETYKDVREELRELKKENEKLKNQEATARKINESLVQRYSSSISVQKIKDKIEELNKKIDESIDNSEGGLDEDFIQEASELLAQKRCLQELIKKED